MQEILEIATPGRGITDVTARVAEVVARSGARTGLCHVFLQHTSASLLVQENADGNVQRDLLDWLARLAPDGDPRYRHDEEGPDDMSAHLRAAITQVSLLLPVIEGRLGLGTWQGLWLLEHRTSPHRRRLVVTVQSVG